VSPIDDAFGIDGWMDEKELRWLHACSSKMCSVVEIGSWKGRSSVALLTGCKGPVFCVDHFNGSASQRDTAHAEAKDGKLFEQFIGNVGMFPNLVVMRMPSVMAASFFRRKSVDMIFIDGDHEYEEFKQDVRVWLPVCRRLFCGHDLGEGGVTKALQDSGLSFKKLIGSIWRCV